MKRILSVLLSAIFLCSMAVAVTSLESQTLYASGSGSAWGQPARPGASRYTPLEKPLGYESVKLSLTRIESPTFGNRTFGNVGQYERLEGILSFEVNPANPLNREIVNLAKAPVNSKGFVEYNVDVVILKPVDMDRGNGRLLYDAVNRGSLTTLRFFNDAPTGYNTSTSGMAGNGFLMERGYTIVASGWQAPYPIAGISSFLVGLGSRLPPTPTALMARLPVATHKDGSPIVGTNREVWYDTPFNVIDGAGYMTKYLTYPAATLNQAEASLTVQAHENDDRKSPPDMTWTYLDEWRIKIKAPEGYDKAAAIYEFIYPAKDPIVYGLGLASIRDVVSFLRYQREDNAGNPNPLGPGGKKYIHTALAFGGSQAGRLLKTFIYEDFNQARHGLKVFDGVCVHISGSRRLWVNGEFSHPGDIFGNDQFPFSYAEMIDHFTGGRDGLLKKCQKSGTCPKIIHTDTESEIWSSGFSLVVTNTYGAFDAKMPKDVRIYMFTGARHSAAAGTDPSYGQQLSNPLDYRPLNRALLVALDDWVTLGIKPPESRYPRISDGTLVPYYQFTTGFPYIPKVTYNGLHLQAEWLDYLTQPPRRMGIYPTYAMKVNKDGNGVAGIRLPDIAVPVGTYTGWNLARAGFSENNRLVTAGGSYIPFAKTMAERMASGDPRLSIEERYPTREAYIEAVTNAALALFSERLLLWADVEKIIERAKAG